MAWRVSVGQAFSGAMACGLLALMVSRGSSMFMEGIEELKGMTGKWESAICFISAVSAGLLLGLDGFMWRESVVVNRIAVTSVPWFLAVLVCLLRWIYAPHQLRYAYWAAFLFGVCFTLASKPDRRRASASRSRWPPAIRSWAGTPSWATSSFTWRTA